MDLYTSGTNITKENEETTVEVEIQIRKVGNVKE
jgi:hypothetical protein